MSVALVPVQGAAPQLVVSSEERPALFLAQVLADAGERGTNRPECAAMAPRVFTEKEPMQQHRTEPRKTSAGFGGAENGPLPTDELHTKHLPLPVLL